MTGCVESNIVDGAYLSGRYINWYGGTKCLITYKSLCDISSMAVYCTGDGGQWGYPASNVTIYYSDDDSLTLESDLNNFNSVTVSTESWQELNEVIHAKRVMLTKNDTTMICEFECLGNWSDYYAVRNPDMKSDTDPYGEVTYSSYYYEGKRAFDSSIDTGWTPVGNEQAIDSFIQYGLNNLFTPVMIKVKWGSEGNAVYNFKYKVQASTDNLNFVDISDEILVTGTKNDVIVPTNNNQYKYFRIVFLTQNYTLHSPNAYSVWVNDFRIYGHY